MRSLGPFALHSRSSCLSPAQGPPSLPLPHCMHRVTVLSSIQAAMSGVHPRYREIFVLVALGCAILVSLSHPVPLNLAARSAAQPDVSGLHQLQPHNTAAQHKALSLAPEESQTANQQPGAPCPPEACNTAQPPRQRTPQDPLPTRSGPGLLPKPGSAWAGALVLSAAAVCGACAYALGYWMRRRQIRGARHVECGPWATLAVGGLPHAPTVPRRGGHSGRTWLLPVKGRGALAPAPLARAVPGPTPPGLRLSGGTALYAAARRQQQTEDPVEAPSAPSDPQQMWKAFTETVASTVSETINQAGERIVSTAAETAAKAVLGLAEEVPLQPPRRALTSGVQGLHLYPPPLCISYALVQATVGVGTVLIWDLILIRYQT